MSDDAPHLFGRPDDEWLQNDLATVYENWESGIDPATDPGWCTPFTIIEWTAEPVGKFVQSTDRILESVYDWLMDDDIILDDNDDQISKVFDSPEVKAAWEAARSVLVAKLNATGWRNADQRVCAHQITWNDAGEPLVDGEPMYVRSEPSSSD